jgi:bleomycin hydrolase
LTAQEKQVEGVGLEFRMVKEIPTTPVKAQSSTSTCWCFASTSFIETEAIRMGKGTHNLSEMFTVYHTYLGKANRYARLHRYGIANFPPGGALNDVPDMMDLYGCVPEEVYDGLEYGSETHNHRELHSVLSTYIEDISTRREYNSRSKSWQDAAYVSPMWEKGFSGLLDAWLGKRPASFTYKGKTYTPESFARSLGFDRDNYVLLSSFNHVPFYREFVIEVPDNWSQGKAWNLPVEEFQEVIRHAVMEGYSVAWASDMRDQYTASKEGIWMLPDATGVENMSNEEKAAFYKTPTPQKKVTQEMRQKGYDTFITTDDHAMHIVGFAEDQDGNPYYWVKNSWGLQGPFEGYQYASESFVVYKSTSIMVHKDALPKDIRNKLGL